MKIEKGDISNLPEGIRRQLEAAFEQSPRAAAKPRARFNLAEHQDREPVQPEPDAAPRTETFFVEYLGRSLNRYVFPAGGGFQYRKDKKACAWACIEAGVGRVPTFQRPVRITYIPQIGKKSRRFDATNYAATTKQIEDCFVQLGMLRQDSNREVVAFTVQAPQTADNGRNGVLVVITEELNNGNFSPVPAGTG